MNKLFFIIILFSGNVFGQCPTPNVPSTAKSISSFIPKGWFIKDSTSGDFNKDGLTDVAIVLASELEHEDIQDYECGRGILILERTKSGYKKSAYSNNAILCQRCGGAFGDPYESIFLKNNLLQVNHYGGSNWRWTQNYTFRFQHNQWQLIGISRDSYFDASECDGDGVGNAGRNLTEVNFSTSKAHIIKTQSTNCKPYKDQWISIRKKPLIALNQFDVEKNYLPFKSD